MASTGVSKTASKRATLAEGIRHHLRYTLAKEATRATKRDVFQALAHTIRQLLMDGIWESERRNRAQHAKRLIYLSAEFLIGQSLRNNLYNMGLLKEAEAATRLFGFNLSEITDSEADAPLGNGGLGRLAACFMESLATMGMPAFGYGINYQFGLFKQEIENGYQREKPEQWLSQSSPWLIERPDEVCAVPLYGRIEHAQDREGNYNPMWVEWQVIVGAPYDLPVVGYGGQTVNYLRLYSARASDEFDMHIFNEGDYLRAVEHNIEMERVSKVLYPSDAAASGRELRLIQEYFLVACALRDTLRTFHRQQPNGSLEEFPLRFAIQMNDTHPALAVAELMRLLVDEHALEWDAAWQITQASCGYTNHTLLPEALEKWPVAMLERVLPRHLQIIHEINRRFLAQAEVNFPRDAGRLARMSLIEEGENRQVRMAHLAIVGSHAVNGVAALHSDLIKRQLVPDFHELWPERFSNKTNGVTHRRWLACANPGLAGLITTCVGEGWITDLSRIRGLEKHANETDLQQWFLLIKRKNKERLARLILQTEQVSVDPGSLFDVQVKRIHEYKRQLLNAMHVIHRYLRLVEDGETPKVQRTHLFAGKAAPGYRMAKLIIKLIHNLASVINNDPRTEGLMKVVFLHDYRVALAEHIMPGADLSEQISMAGTEASGTGNMKLAMNGAVSIGTPDGANIEIMEEVGRENFYLFGLSAKEIDEQRGSYNPWDRYHGNAIVRRVLDALGSSRFCPEEPDLFHPLVETLLDHGDYYFHLADFDAYVSTQEEVDGDFQCRPQWARKAILNVARSGKFASDRTVMEYARDIWDLKPVKE